MAFHTYTDPWRNCTIRPHAILRVSDENAVRAETRVALRKGKAREIQFSASHNFRLLPVAR